MAAASARGRDAPDERAHLEVSHDELCTALTSLRSNVELVRHRLAPPTRPPSAQDEVAAHLAELDAALDRLERLAARMRAWHAGGQKMDAP